jgi:hypothetical protein
MWSFLVICRVAIAQASFLCLLDVWLSSRYAASVESPGCA